MVGNMPMGFPSPWAAWLAFPPPGWPPPPPGGPPPLPPGRPPLSPPDRPVPPGMVLDCTWVVMAMVINMMALSSMGWGAMDIAWTVADKLTGDWWICLLIGSSSLLPKLVWYLVKMGMSLYSCGALPCILLLWLSMSGSGRPRVKYVPSLSKLDKYQCWFLRWTEHTCSSLVCIAYVG